MELFTANSTIGETANFKNDLHSVQLLLSNESNMFMLNFSKYCDTHIFAQFVILKYY